MFAKIQSFLILAVLFILLALSSCKTGGCIRIEGSYDDYSGAFEYCLDGEGTKDIGVPVLDSVKGKNYILSEEQIKEIDNLISNDISTKSTVPVWHVIKKIINSKK